MDVPMGEWSDTLYTTDEIQTFCDQVKTEVEKKTGRNYAEYKAVFYRVKNILVHHYIIKVYVGDDYLHLHLCHSASTGRITTELMGVQQHHK